MDLSNELVRNWLFFVIKLSLVLSILLCWALHIKLKFVIWLLVTWSVSRQGLIIFKRLGSAEWAFMILERNGLADDFSKITSSVCSVSIS